jgi:hypothetical protein
MRAREEKLPAPALGTYWRNGCCCMLLISIGAITPGAPA